MTRIEFERTSPEAVGISSAQVNHYIDELETSGTEMHGLMIMRHGKVCTEGWWQPYGPGLRHGDQSLTKTYAATGVGIACTEGLVKLEDRIIDLFPEYAPAEPSENLQKMTVRDVLCMGCGMDTMPAPTKDWIRDFLAIPVTHVPGTAYMYNSVGSTLLAAIVKKVSGEGLHEYLTKRLFTKIGIDPDNLRWMYMPDGTEVGGGGLYSTTEDNLRLMKLYADGGVWNGDRILSEEYVRKATSLQNGSATESAGNPEATDNFVGYGFQMWMCKPKGVYRADGAMGQFSIVIPDLDMLISINETASGAHWAQKTLDITWQFIEAVRQQNEVEQNSEESARLQYRLKHLSLEAPKYQLRNTAAGNVCGSVYQVDSGCIQFGDMIVVMMSGGPVSKGIEQIQFKFHSDAVEINFVQDHMDYAVTAAMDGTRRFNHLQFSGSPISQLYLNAYWQDDTTLSVAVRWIETCFEKEFKFAFAEDGKSITVYEEPTVGGFGMAKMECRKVASAVRKEN
ncbi:MAG: beta-lactamase family protein [Solobacterium sp.]|jgi:hypothetical protein|nr:beta-lactamase family protein [Solobacterium sp.]